MNSEDEAAKKVSDPSSPVLLVLLLECVRERKTQRHIKGANGIIRIVIKNEVWSRKAQWY